MKLSNKKKKKIHWCLDLIQFGMRSKLLNFQDRFFEYKGNGYKNDIGLAIGGYESAFLADLVASFIFEKTEHLLNDTRYKEIYRDDGLIIFKNTLKYLKIVKFLKKNQGIVDTIAGGDFFQFTMDAWIDKSQIDIDLTEKVSISKKNSFPFLEVKLFWDDEDLNFEVYKKKGNF